MWLQHFILGLIDLFEAQIFCIYKIKNIVVIRENKNFIFAII